MNISLENSDKVSAVLTIQMGKADYQDEVTKSLKNMSHKAQMPGFRPGKVPMGLIKKMYGTQAKLEVINKMLSENMYKYISDNKISVLGEPMVSESQKTQDFETAEDFEFKFDLALSPEFKAELTDKDKVDYYDIELSDKMVDDQVNAYAQSAGHPEAADVYADRDVVRGALTELGEDGAPKTEGISVDKASLMPAYFKGEDEKKLFEGAKVGDIITIDLGKAYDNNDTELASLLKIDKANVGEHNGKYTFQIEEISRFTPSEINQELFDRIFGKDAVKNEEEFRNKIKEGINVQLTSNSDYKFLLDVRAYMEKKVGDLTFPDELLKRFMKAQNKDKGDKFVEDNYAKSIEELKWHLIKEQLVAANSIKIENDEVKDMAKQATRYQFAQYGMNNIPEEYVEKYAEEMMKKQDQVNNLVERCIDNKLTAVLKNVVKLNHKAISMDDFNKLLA